jgi:hypothetical protein
MIWDSHAHLDDPVFLKDFEQVVARIRSAGVSRVTNIGCDLPTSEQSVKLARDYNFIYAAIGVHPHFAEGATDDTWEKLLLLAKKPKVLAWGKIIYFTSVFKANAYNLNHREAPPCWNNSKANTSNTSLGFTCCRSASTAFPIANNSNGLFVPF